MKARADFNASLRRAIAPLLMCAIGALPATAQSAGVGMVTDLQGQAYVLGGDVIIASDGESISGMEDLIAIINQHKPGDTVTLTVVGGDSTKDVRVTLTARPSTMM